MWLLAAAVAVMAVAFAACGVGRCPAVTEAMALVALTELSLALSSIAMLLLSYCTEALISEALGGAVVLWELVSAPFVLLGLGAVLLVMSPPLEGWSRLERIGSAIHGAGTLGMAAIYVLLRCLPEFSTDDVEARASILRKKYCEDGKGATSGASLLLLSSAGNLRRQKSRRKK